MSLQRPGWRQRCNEALLQWVICIHWSQEENMRLEEPQRPTDERWDVERRSKWTWSGKVDCMCDHWEERQHTSGRVASCFETQNEECQARRLDGRKEKVDCEDWYREQNPSGQLPTYKIPKDLVGGWSKCRDCEVRRKNPMRNSHLCAIIRPYRVGINKIIPKAIVEKTIESAIHSRSEIPKDDAKRKPRSSRTYFDLVLVVCKRLT